MRRRRRTGTAAVVMALTQTLAFAACDRVSAEEQLLQKFFEASRLMDRTALADLATIEFDPRSDGSIQQVRIESVAEEVRDGVLTKRVTFSARVHPPGGTDEQRTMTATLQRRDDHWLVAALQR